MLAEIQTLRESLDTQAKLEASRENRYDSMEVAVFTLADNIRIELANLASGSTFIERQNLSFEETAASIKSKMSSRVKKVSSSQLLKEVQNLS